VTQLSSGHLRGARAEDGAQLLRLWDLLFDEGGATPKQPWKSHARTWFTRYVDDAGNARFPVIEVDGEVVATAIGTLEIGVPNPQCARGAPCASRGPPHEARSLTARSRTWSGIVEERGEEFQQWASDSE